MSTRRSTAKRKDEGEDSHSDGDGDIVRNLRRKSIDPPASPGVGAGAVDQNLSWLEAELEKVNLERTTVRNERDKQRQQLAGLGQENDQLTHQKEQRIKRSQLQSQLQDLERSVRKKTSKKQRAVEDLEQSKSRHRQLHKTMELLERGVQSILEKSYFYDQKDSKTDEGKLRTGKRQELLKGLLSEELKMKLLTSSVSGMHFGDAGELHRNAYGNIRNYADEDDDIHDGEEDLPMISLYADKNKRHDSVNSEMSENDYLQQAAAVYRVPSAASAGHNNRSRSRSRSQSRKTKSTGRSPSTGGSRRDRSNSRGRDSTRSNGNKSQSSRRGGKRPNKNAKAEEDDHISHSTSNKSKNSGLASMLESSRSGHSDEESDDTPKTANTNG
ncbi:MAG: hypothetical protein SGILL_000892 [Bacillariaceae sp.]